MTHQLVDLMLKASVVLVILGALLTVLLYRQFGLLYLSPSRRTQTKPCLEVGDHLQRADAAERSDTWGLVTIPNGSPAEIAAAGLAISNGEGYWHVDIAERVGDESTAEIVRLADRLGAGVSRIGSHDFREICPASTSATPLYVYRVAESGEIIHRKQFSDGKMRACDFVREVRGAQPSEDQLLRASFLRYIDATSAADPALILESLHEDALLGLGAGGCVATREAIVAYLQQEIFTSGYRIAYGTPRSDGVMVSVPAKLVALDGSEHDDPLSPGEERPSVWVDLLPGVCGVEAIDIR